MTIILFVITGFIMGYKYRMTPTAYIIMTLATITFISIQFLDLLIIRDKSEMTILPIVIGFSFVLFMFIGSLFHLVNNKKPKAFGSR